MALLARTDERLHIPLAMDNTTAGTQHRPYTTDWETNAPPSEETDPVGVHPGLRRSCSKATSSAPTIH